MRCILTMQTSPSPYAYMCVTKPDGLTILSCLSDLRFLSSLLAASSPSGSDLSNTLAVQTLRAFENKWLMFAFGNTLPKNYNAILQKNTGCPICSCTWVWMTLILSVPLAARFCLGWWEFGRSGWVTKSSRPNPGARADGTPCTGWQKYSGTNSRFRAGMVGPE